MNYVIEGVVYMFTSSRCGDIDSRIYCSPVLSEKGGY